MIVDSHCHAWPRWPFSRAVPDPSTRGSGESLLFEMDSNGVDHAVIVCARVGGSGGTRSGWSNPDNNDYATGLALSHPDRLTAWIDVDGEWTAEHHTPGAADRLVEMLDRYRARGFTHYLRRENDGWLRTDDAHEFFTAAQERGAIASLSCGVEWFDDLSAILQEHPRLTVLLHHLGGPRRGMAQDIDRVVDLARHPNLGVKVSGLHYFAEDAGEYPYPGQLPAIALLHRAFGGSRLYWGSDFPASVGMVTYRQSLEIVRTHCRFLGEDDRRRVLGGNLAELLEISG